MSEFAVRPVSLLAAAARRGAFKPLYTHAVSPEPELPTVDQYAQGLADGQSMAAAAFAAERSSYQKLLAATQALQPDAGPELSVLLRETVVRLVEQMVHRVEIDPAFLEMQIARALAVITEADEARRILLHPEDAALVGERVNSLTVCADASMMRGTIRIECSQGWIEHGVALGLERLREILHCEGSAA